jgi:hypothetical protein
MPPLVIKAVVAIFWDRASNRYTWAAHGGPPAAASGAAEFGGRI